MSQLCYSLRDLRVLFERNLTAKDIAEALVSFDMESSAQDVKHRLDALGFDVAGAREGGLVTGFFYRERLGVGALSGYAEPFGEQDLLPDTAPLSEVLSRLSMAPRVFVLSLGHVAGIVTRGDLQKAPVRMWLFGLVSLLEMQLLRLIREAYPAGGWERCVSVERVAKAERVLRDRRRRDEEIDLVDCLELTDKAQIVRKTSILREALELPSKKTWESEVEDLRCLRDDLAHAQALRSGQWPKLMAQVERIQALLIRAEETVGIGSPGVRPIVSESAGKSVPV